MIYKHGKPYASPKGGGGGDTGGGDTGSGDTTARPNVVSNINSNLMVQDKATKRWIPLQFDATGGTGITVTLSGGAFRDAEGLPANVASAAAYGTSVFAARRDHVHTIGAGVVTGTMIANTTITNANITNATIDLTTKVTGALPTLNGGTGAALTPAIGDILYATSGTTMARLADVAAGSYLRSGGVTTAPLWSTLTLPNSATTGDILYATGTNAIGNLADVAAGSYLRSGGAGTAPVWSTPTLPNAAGTALKWLRSDGTNFITSTATLAEGAVTSGKILVSDGTNWVASTPTFPNASSAAGTMIRSDATNWVATSAPTTTDSNADNIIGASGTTKKVMVLQAKASQTANVLEVQDSTGAVDFNITPDGWVQNKLGMSRVTTQQDINTTTAMTNITGLSWTLKAGRTYSYRIMVFVTTGATPGIRMDLNGGSATATSYINHSVGYDDTGSAFSLASRQTSLATSPIFNFASASTAFSFEFVGTITVNAGGTFIPRYSQSVSNGTNTSILVGSFGWFEDMP